jgi:enamine deaminase RidA (YjgF/YER057c/UK114 family)
MAGAPEFFTHHYHPACRLAWFPHSWKLRPYSAAERSGSRGRMRKIDEEGTGMAAHTIRKASREGIGYAVVDLPDVRHLFVAAVPRRGATLHEQADDALRAIDAVAEAEGARGSIVLQSVFLADAGQIGECRRIMRKFYGRDLPATSYIPQRPCDGKLLSIEVMGVGQGLGEVTIERPSEQIVIARHNDIAWVHCAHVVPHSQAAGMYEDAINAFQQMRSLLHGAGVRFDQVIRTWLYLGGIVADEGAVQRYQELNRARTDFYRDIPFLAGHLLDAGQGPIYPASTGIGADGRGFMMSAMALVTGRNDVVAMPLENPRQTAAYDYGANYSAASPKFSRAMALSCGPCATIFVSGTASITHSETRHVGDATAQTEETLQNIAALISEENVARHGLPGLGSTLESLGLVRVYVKRQEDYARTRAVCEKYLGDLPTIYAVADVCRPELLVEIEAVAFSRKAPA